MRARATIRRGGPAAIAAVVIALLAAASPVEAASPPAAACQEYVVCGAPVGGPSVGGGVPPERPTGQKPQPGPRPSVSSRTDLPLTSYPLTPAIAIPAVVLVAGLVAGLTIRLGRRGRGRRDATAVATSARAR